MFYSKSTGGFYDEAVHAAMPSDAVSVSADLYRSLFAAQAAGLTIVADSNGAPTAVTPASLRSIEDIRASQSALLSGQCEAEIIGGFSSSALGTAHTYGSQDHDQRNLSDAMSASLTPGLADGWTTKLWCASGGAWIMADHTAARVQTVHSDWLTFRLARQTKLAGLIAQVTAASTADAVLGITW